jgi:hypothetical protein
MMDKADEVRELLNKMFGTQHEMTTFPDELYVLSNGNYEYFQVRLPQDDYGLTWGLACFSYSEYADAFIEACENESLRPESISFDDTRKLAQDKLDVDCLYLLDDPNKVGVHWVK